ncbi:MAG: Rod shape-determining protein MreD [Bacteroidota bacterium]
MNRYNLYKIISFFIYLMLQVFVFNKIVLLDTAHSFIYIGFLLTLPFELAVIPGMLIGMLMGLGVDAFSNTFGLHAAASVFIMYLRPMMLSGLTPQGGYPAGVVPKPNVLGLGWFTYYSLPLIFVHQIIIFFVEYGGFSMFGQTSSKVIASTIYSFLLIVIFQYMFKATVRR